MTSTRLPGKVLKEVMGRPLLSYLIERLRACRLLEKIVIATTTKKEDDAVLLLAEKESLPIYRGSENDVLDRYYQTGRKFGVEHVVRVTSDCPLIDPQICDHVVEVYLRADVDYVHTDPTFAEGVDCEAFSFKALEKAWHGASLKSEREHVTLYFHNHPELFKKVTLVNETDDSRYRITVDEKEDFLVVKAILENLYKGKDHYFSIQEIKSFLDTHPEIYKLNAHIIRNEGLLKSLNEVESI